MLKLTDLMRRQPVDPLRCRRCDALAAFRVEHSERGAFGYCLTDFRRLGDVPPGSVVSLVGSPTAS
jgi:hypothetical protein